MPFTRLRERVAGWLHPDGRTDEEHQDERPVHVERWTHYEAPLLGGKSSDSAATQAGSWAMRFAVAGVLALAGAMGYVSFWTQRLMVHAVKGDWTIATLEGLGPDIGALVFGMLGYAEARRGRGAMASRVLSLACVATALAMNVLGVGTDSYRALAVAVMPPALYAVASDRLIAVVRARARAKFGTDSGSIWGVFGGLFLWLLRLTVALPSTARLGRNWVIENAPVAPGQTLSTLRAAAAVEQAGEVEQAAAAARAEAEQRAAEQVQQAREQAEQRVTDAEQAAADRVERVRAETAAQVEQAQTEARRAVEQVDEVRRSSQHDVEEARREAAELRAELERAENEREKSKRDVLWELYAELGQRSDPRFGDRERVGEVARELHERAGLAHPSTAGNYIRDWIDRGMALKHGHQTSHPGDMMAVNGRG